MVSFFLFSSMKKFCLYIVCSLFVSISFGQTRVDYRDANYLSCDSASAKYIFQTGRNDIDGRWVQNIYTPEMRLLSKTSYKDSTLDIIEGCRTMYHYNGVVKTRACYVDGILDGEVLCMYSNGITRRNDIYQYGNLVEGACYASNGMKITYFDFEKPARYVGGIPALYTAISVNSQSIKIPETEKITGNVKAILYINAEGSIVDVRIVQGLHPLYDAEVIRICKHLGKFDPAELDGEPVNSTFPLLISF